MKYGGRGGRSRRAITVGGEGLGEREVRVGWVGVVGEGEPYQIFVRVWVARQDVENSPLTLTDSHHPPFHNPSPSYSPNPSPNPSLECEEEVEEEEEEEEEEVINISTDLEVEEEV